MDPELIERLKKLDEDFKAASSEGNDPYALPEPGTYQAILKEIDTFEGSADKTQYLKITFEIVMDREYAGREVDKIYSWIPDENMDPEKAQQRLSFFKKDLKTLGADVDSPEFTYTQVYPGSSFWEEFLDVPVELAVVDSKKVNPETNKPWRNVYLNERIGDPMPGGFQPKSDVPNGLSTGGPQVTSMAGHAVPPVDDYEIPFGPSVL